MPEKPVEVRLGELLRARGLKLATAESCTGGLIGHKITSVPGSSEYYLGGVVSYAYEAKVELLGVHWKTLRAHGAVSRETVLEMANGARERLNADLGLAVSGIAGPGGGMPNKPVGLTWIGLSTNGEEQAWTFVFPGERGQVKEQAANTALQLALEYLEPGSGIKTEARKKVKPTRDAVEAEARLERDGRLIPQWFNRNGTTYMVASYGRRWDAEDGQHMLVMDHKAQVYELVFSPADQSWYLNKPIKTGKRAFSS